ncbi:MAG: glycosyltransferase family 4 protein [Vicinamibacterales bacterium]
MHVSIASFIGGIHLFELARELDELGALGRYYTAMPSFKVTGVAHSRVATHPIVLLPHVVLQAARLQRFQSRINWATTEAFDRWLSRSDRPCDVFHVASSYGLRAMRCAKSKYGSLTVCDRGSSHIRAQDALLREEAARTGVPAPSTDPRFIAKEEAEYDEADAIFVPSTFARESFLRTGIASHKVVAIPIGIRLEEFFPVPKRDDTFRVLCVAMLSVRKGIGYLLEAMSRLALPNSEVLLRGTVLPESAGILSRYEGRFRLQSPLPRAQMRDLYSQASVLVLPSIEDGFGQVIVQAMACGVPVITTTNTGGPDVITDGKDGFIVPIRDARAIAERLEHLYRHPDARAAMGRAALETVRTWNGWGRYTTQVLNAYRERRPHHDAR